MEKHEQHLLNFKKKKMIRLRKEQENYREEPEREQVGMAGQYNEMNLSVCSCDR